jgi:hypothetical protein
VACIGQAAHLAEKACLAFYLSRIGQATPVVNIIFIILCLYRHQRYRSLTALR